MRKLAWGNQEIFFYVHILFCEVVVGSFSAFEIIESSREELQMLIAALAFIRLCLKSNEFEDFAERRRGRSRNQKEANSIAAYTWKSDYIPRGNHIRASDARRVRC